MDPSPTTPDEARFVFCIRGDGWFLSRTEAELTLSAEGISYALDGRSGLRRYAGLKGIRLQMMSPEPKWSAVIELEFLRGRSLLVYSHLPGGGRSLERDRAFTAFVAGLHRRLGPEDRSRVAFRRGISPVRHRIVVACAAIFAAPALFLLLAALFGPISLGEAIWPIIGCSVFAGCIANGARMARPGSYDPERLPDDLVPTR